MRPHCRSDPFIFANPYNTLSETSFKVVLRITGLVERYGRAFRGFCDENGVQEVHHGYCWMVYDVCVDCLMHVRDSAPIFFLITVFT